MYDEQQWFPASNRNYSQESVISSSINFNWSTTSSMLGFIILLVEVQKGSSDSKWLDTIELEAFPMWSVPIWQECTVHLGIPTTGRGEGGGIINITKVLSLVQEKVQICELKQHKSAKGSDSWPESQNSVLHQNHQVPLIVQYEHK